MLYLITRYNIGKGGVDVVGIFVEEAKANAFMLAHAGEKRYAYYVSKVASDIPDLLKGAGK